MLDDQLDGLLGGLVGLDRDQVRARDHHLANPHVPHFEDAVDHLAFFFLEDAFLLAHRDQQFELFLGYERAANLRLSAKHQENQPSDPGQDKDDRAHHERRGSHQSRHPEGHPLRTLQGQRLGRDFAKHENDQRQYQADQPLGHPLLIEMQGQQGRGRGRHDDRDGIHDQDRRQIAVWILMQPLDDDGLRNFLVDQGA